MPQVIEPEQVAAVGHRLHFFGRPSGSDTVSWEYRNQTWLFERPEDGEEPSPEAVLCETCGRTLTYTVHSVEDTRRRVVRFRRAGWLLVPVGLIGLIGFFTVDQNSGFQIISSLVLFFGGFVGAWTALKAAGSEIGVTGHGASYPGPTKHNVQLIPVV
jgi:hypothetical protein